MFRKGCFSILVVALGLVVLAGTQAYAVSGSTADTLAYDYYALRGTANIISVGGVTTAPGCVMPVPTGKQAFTYSPVAEPVIPVIDCNPALAKPIGVSMGVDDMGEVTVTIKVSVGPFEAPVDVSIGLFMASFDASDIYFINVYNQLTSLQEEIEGEAGADTSTDAASPNGKANGNDKDNGNGKDNNNGKDNGNVNNGSDNSDKQPPASDDPKPKKKFKRLTVWKGDTQEVNEVIGPVNVNDLPSGLYVLILNVTRVSPADNNFDRFYRWVTYFIVPDKTQ